MRSLFRDEYLKSYANRWQGEAQLARRPAFSVIASVAVLLAACVIAVAMFGTAARKVTAFGTLVPRGGILQVSSRAAGTLTLKHVDVGSFVEKGAALFEVAVDSGTARGSMTDLIANTIGVRRRSLKEEIAFRESQTARIVASLVAQADALDQKERDLTREDELLARRIALAEKAYARFTSMSQAGFISEAMLQTKEEDLLALQSRAAELSSGKRELLRERRSLDASKLTVESQSRSELAELQRALEVLEQSALENEARGRVVIPAPQAGFITSINVPLGAAVKQQQIIASILPGLRDGATTLDAEIYVPSSAIGFLDKGQSVRMRYSSFPHQKFGLRVGQIVHVEKTPVALDELWVSVQSSIAGKLRSAEPVYRVRVQVTDQSIDAFGKTVQLRAGMLLDADIVQERRAIWEWMFEPVLAARSRYQS